MSKVINMKTPISYYGGKQSMLSHILPLIPEHVTYVEPFFGGGAVFFSKPPSKAEIVNDVNRRLMTFYRVLKYDFDDLQSKIDETFHSRDSHRDAGQEYRSGKTEIQDELAMAWSVWVQTNMSFSAMIGAGFGFDLRGGSSKKIANKKAAFTQAFQERMRTVTLESYDVLKVMRAYDSPDSFFYLDPPYVSAEQGHYRGYTKEHFDELLAVCQDLRGKFLLSSYPEPELLEARRRNDWSSKDVVKTLTADGSKSRKGRTKVKTECLTWNY